MGFTAGLNPMGSTAVIFDCDPGVDDGVALLLAFAARDTLNLLGITTVAGNVSAKLTARNACILREIASREDVPVFAGCERPLVRPPIEAGHFHGESGLGDLPLFEPQQPAESEHAVDWLIRTLSTAPARSISLVVTGPLTNIATALLREPTIVRALREIAIMGGARSEGGNITASAEYNIYADPHAAQAVFSADVEIVTFGLDVTHQVRATPERIDAIAGLATRSASAAANLLTFATYLPANSPAAQGSPLHDPCPIAWLIEPRLFEFRRCHIEVETESSLTAGHTAVEFRSDIAPRQNVQWGVRADAEGIFDLLRCELSQSGKA
ncbi:MAG: nucleoside hydrolase [Steroidobacteraceae bacterium]